MRLVLASGSPRRAELLRAAGFTFDIVAPEIDERVRGAESPGDYVRRLAGEKSAAGWGIVTQSRDRGPGLRLAQAIPSRPKDERAALLEGADIVVLGADTVVVVEGEMLGKPRDEEEAAGMLRRLSGRRHEVMTGVSLRSKAAERGLIEVTGVYMKDLDQGLVSWYVASGEGLDKAGAYGIQGLASRFIPRIEGSYTNVVGLPVAAVSLLLSELASAG